MNEKEWTDDTALKELLSYLTKTYFNENQVELSNKWIETLMGNLYFSIEHFKEMNAEEWVALKIPLRVRSLIRKIINFEEGSGGGSVTNSAQSSTEDLRGSSNFSSRRRKSRTITAQTVKKTTSNSSILPPSTPNKNDPSHRSLTSIFSHDNSNNSHNSHNPLSSSGSHVTKQKTGFEIGSYKTASTPSLPPLSSSQESKYAEKTKSTGEFDLQKTEDIQLDDLTSAARALSEGHLITSLSDVPSLSFNPVQTNQHHHHYIESTNSDTTNDSNDNHSEISELDYDTSKDLSDLSKSDSAPSSDLILTEIIDNINNNDNNSNDNNNESNDGKGDNENNSIKKKKRSKKNEKEDENNVEDLEKKGRTKRTTSQPKISKIDPSKLMLDIKNLSSSDYLFEKSSKKESERDVLSPSSDLKSPNDEKSKKKSEGKEGKEGKEGREGKSHRRKGSRQESSRSRTLDRSSEKSSEKLPIKIEKLNMEKLNHVEKSASTSAVNVFKRPPSADRNFIHAIEKSSSDKTSARTENSPQFDTSTFDTFEDSLQSLEKMDKASFSKSLPKGLLRSKSSKFQKIMTDSFWKDPFHSSSNSPSSSSSSNNNSSNNLASTSSHSIASMDKDEIYRLDDDNNNKVKKGYKGVVTVGGDISVSTKLLNYFSFYSKSQFFSELTMGIKNKEKILEVSVYDEQVECTFENGSRGTAEDCLEKDVIILTFSIIDPTSLNNLLLTYMPLLKKRGYPKHLVYLVGIEADKRDVKDRRHVSIEQTEQVLKNLRGLTYCEIGRLDTKASVDNLQMLVMNCARLILCNLKSKENKFNKWVSKFGGIQKMISLQEAEADINLRKCRLEVVPVQLLFLRSFITKLRLSSNLFKFFPIEVLLIEGLQELDLSNNQISIIPNNINKLSKLTSLNLESNKLEILPLSSLQEITTLQEIKLKGNPLSQMPRSTINRKKSGLLSSYDEINAIDQSILLPPSSPSNTLCLSPSSSTSPAPLTAKSKLSLLFSVEIEKILEEDRKLSPHIQIPIFVQRTVNFIITSGMDKQGIFRMEGNVKSMQDLRDSFDSGIYIDYMKFEDVNNVTSLLKFWLRSLPTPLLPNATSLLTLYDEIDPFSSITSLDLFNQIVQSSERSSIVLVKEKNNNNDNNDNNDNILDSDDDDDYDEEGLRKDREKIEKLKNFLEQIPRPIYRVCFTIFRLCNLINRNSENNKMDEGNLSKVIATNLVNLPENENSNNMITNITKIQNIVTFLISFYSSFFLPSPTAIFENDFLSEFETPFASVIYKLSAKHKSITTMNICNTSMGKRLWVADDAGMISIWDINDVEMIFLVCTLECNKRVNCLLAVDDKVWVGCIDAVHIRRGTDGDLIHTIDHPGYNFELTSKKSNIWSFLQSNVSQIKIFDTKKMKIIKEFQIQSRVISIVKIKKEIWIACHNRIIYVYSIKGRELIKEVTTEHQDRVTSLCIVGKNEVWSSANDGIHVFDINTKELKEKIKTTTEIMGLMWVKDQVWAYSWDASIFVYNATTKEYIGKMKSYHNQPISTVISNYSPSSPNSWNSFSASYDHTIVVWQCRPLPSTLIKDDK